MNRTVNVDRLDAHPVREIALADRVFGYRSAGDGPALVLLHGIGSGAGSWVGQLDAFSSHRTVVAWDAPGYGVTTPLTASAPTAADYATALADFLDALGVVRADVVGHSLGALMAAAFARANPARVRSLTLASPAIGHGDAPASERESKLDARIGQMRELGPDGLARERAARLVSGSASEAAIELVRANMRRLNPAGYEQAARLLSGGRLLDDVAACKVPLFVICGEMDTITPPAGARRVAAAGGANYRELAGAGHACYIEAPQSFNDAISRFTGEFTDELTGNDHEQS